MRQIHRIRATEQGAQYEYNQDMKEVECIWAMDSKSVVAVHFKDQFRSRNFFLDECDSYFIERNKKGI